MENHPNWSESDTNILLGKYILILKLLGFSPLFFPMSECYSVQRSNGIPMAFAGFLESLCRSKISDFSFHLPASQKCFWGSHYLQFMTHYEVWKQKHVLYAVCFSWWNPLIFMQIFLVKTPRNPQIKTSYPHLQSAQCSLLFRLYWVPWGIQAFLRWMSLWYPPGKSTYPHPIPPWEKGKSSTQTYLGWGYVSSQEGKSLKKVDSSFFKPPGVMFNTPHPVPWCQKIWYSVV